jgi:hypothetical protein
MKVLSTTRAREQSYFHELYELLDTDLECTGTFTLARAAADRKPLTKLSINTHR